MTVTILPWRHASELAFVRDCFFPHHHRGQYTASSASSSPFSPATTGIDEIYAAPSQSATDNAENMIGGDSAAQKTQQRARAYQAGLQRVAVWRFRSPGNVPRAVVVTAGLVDAVWHDQVVFRGGTAASAKRGSGIGDGIEGGVSETSMKSIYAMAFLRFVNAFVDRDVSRSVRRTGLSKLPAQGVSDEDELGEDDGELQATAAGGFGAGAGVPKGTGESSMYAHASSIGMPSTFVDLRHRCVHGEVPRLDVLRSMGRKALEWLWERWWKGNAVGDAGRWVWEVKKEEEEMLRRNGEMGREVEEKYAEDVVMINHKNADGLETG